MAGYNTKKCPVESSFNLCFCYIVVLTEKEKYVYIMK